MYVRVKNNGNTFKGHNWGLCRLCGKPHRHGHLGIRTATWDIGAFCRGKRLSVEHREKISRGIRASAAYEAAHEMRVASGHAHLNKPIIHPNLQASPQLAYLLGALKGDGCVYFHNGGSRPRQDACIELGATTPGFVDAVAAAMQSIGLRPCRFTKDGENPKHKTLYLVLAHSLAFVNWYRSLGYPDLKAIVKGMEHHFLRGFFEAEGSLYWRKANKKFSEVSLCNTDQQLIEVCRMWLIEMGFHPKITITEHLEHKTLYSLRLFRISEVQDFILRIGPCIKNGGLSCAASL